MQVQGCSEQSASIKQSNFQRFLAMIQLDENQTISNTQSLSFYLFYESFQSL